jgi:hypothetical protein
LVINKEKLPLTDNQNKSKAVYITVKQHQRAKMPVAGETGNSAFLHDFIYSYWPL